MIGPYELNTIYCGECSEMMTHLPADSIPFWLTSPPYDSLREYRGYTFDFEAIARQLYRITQPGGVGVWVVADETKEGGESGNSFRQALYFMGLGFSLLDTMGYGKVNPQPLNPKQKYNPNLEFMFVFTKGRPKTVNLITVPCIQAGRVAGGRMRNNNQDSLQPKTAGHKPVKDSKVKDNLWLYHIGGDDEVEHPAKFPEALARDHILSWSNPGDLVFDPMVGSGTTPKMAHLTGRNFLGFEISEEYCQIARKRLEATMSQPALFNPYQAEIATQPVQLSLEAQITPEGQR